MPTTARTSVFISYSHADSHWLELLNTHLKPLARDHKVEIWSDQKIRKGEQWRERIHAQMAKARVAIFLVSASFLGSDFIHAEELPPLLKAAKQAGATLLTIIVRPCAGSFRDSPLSQLQTINSPQAPLSSMSENEQEQVMDSVYEELRNIFGKLATTTRKPTKTKIKPAAPAAPKRLKTTPAAKSAAETEADKEKARKQRLAIARRKAREAAKKLAEESSIPTKNPTTRKLAAKPTTTRTRKKS